MIERRITRDEVYIADEAFFTGTAAEVTPIREVDGRRSAAAAAARSPRSLQSRYFDVVHGRSAAHLDWLNLVESDVTGSIGDKHEHEYRQADKGNVIKVSRQDLPLSCPRPQDELWNMHPRVYLPIEKDRRGHLSYCGARYAPSD